MAYRLYDELGYSSFNLAIYGAPTPGYQLNLRLVARSSLLPYYRSDSTIWNACIGRRR